MSRTCPNGHLSAAEDYCDTCGVPMPEGDSAAPYAAGPAPAGTPAPPGAAAGVSRSSLDLDPDETSGAGPAEGSADEQVPAELLDCPNCQAPNPPGALFCEACGYDFTTGAMPRGAGGEVSTPSSVRVPPSSGTGFNWVAEVWVDPDWYRTQEVEDPCPSPGLPTIVPLRRTSVMLGRVSASKNTHPEIELSSDPGVSRRHAQLTTDGTRWFVEDLGSSNGTFVGPASGALPEEPIPVGPKTELSDDDRLYVGAWTRVVVRRATPEDIQTFA